MEKEKRRYIIHTPAGKIYTNSLQDCLDCKKMYGYFYTKNDNYNG